GIDSGQRLRVPGQGMPGAQGGPAGDLYVDVELAPDERFERDGLDLITRATITFADAALGGQLSLDLPDDTCVTVDIPAGTQPREEISAKGRGAPRVEGRGKGALQIIVQIEVPRSVSPRAREPLRELDGELAKQREKAKTA